MTLSEVLSQPGTLQIPGAYDALSARLIVQAGFPIVYFTGLGNEASDLGFPDLGLTTATEMARRAGNLVQCVDVPVISDADTGFGGLVNVTRTVRLFEQAGVAAIHLEDQTFPKRCGLLEGKQVVPAADFAQVLDTALAARRSDDFMIIARTDAKGTDGLDGVIDRLKRYADHGAGAVMLGDFYTLAEYERIASALPLPLVACAADRENVHRQPDYPLADWESAGVKVVLYWHLPVFAALAAVREAVTALKRDGSTAALDRVAGYGDYAEATDLADWLRLGDGG
jgi:2-methylisocitrate lyase-like PEP mutase family enzyme